MIYEFSWLLISYWSSQFSLYTCSEWFVLWLCQCGTNSYVCLVVLCRMRWILWLLVEVSTTSISSTCWFVVNRHCSYRFCLFMKLWNVLICAYSQCSSENYPYNLHQIEQACRLCFDAFPNTCMLALFSILAWWRGACIVGDTPTTEWLNTWLLCVFSCEELPGELQEADVKY